MLDRILNFLFRKKIGVLVVIASMCAIGFTMTGCFGWSMLSCFCGGLGCDACEELYEECDDTFSCDTGCALLDCMFGYGCEEDCGDCTLSCGGCNSTMCTDCDDAGCGSDGCGILNFTCTKNDDGSDYSGEDGCSGCSDDVYDEYYQVGIKYYLIVDGKDGSQKSHTVTSDKVYEEDKPPKSCTFNVSSFYKETYYDLKYILDENDATVKVNEDGDFTLTVSDYSEWKSGVKTHYLPGVYKVVLNEKRHDDPVNIYLGYVGVDKEGNYVSGIDKETELKTTVKVGDTFPDENVFTASDIEGYTFKGYYYVSISNKKAENSTIANYMVDYNLKESHYGVWEFSGMGSDFHLSTYNIDPTSETLEFTVIAVYEEIKSDVDVKIYKNGQFTELEKTIESGLTHDYKLSDLKDKIVEYNESMKSRNTLKNAEFIGWSTTENGTGGIHTFDELESSDIKINTDMTIYLFYKTKAKIVLHNYEKPDVGREEITAKDGNDLYYGDSYTLPELTKNGRFTFAGWYKDENLTDAVTSLNISIGSDVENFYAKWNEKTTFNAKYYLNRENYNGGYSAGEFRYDYNDGFGALTDSDGTFVSGNIPNGYTFSGWFVLDEDGNKITEEPVTSLASQTYESDLSLIAAYARKVILSTNTNKTYMLYHGESFKLPTSTTTDSSKEFAGWSSVKDNAEKILSDKDGNITAFKLEIIGDSETSVLYPIWKNKTYTVKFMNGETVLKSLTVEHGKTVDSADMPADPTAPEGYQFDGWYDNSNNAFSLSKTVTSNVVYTAKFSPKTYTITLMLDSSNEFMKITIKYGEIKKLDPPTDSSRGTFMGWRATATGGKEWTGSDGVMTNAYKETSDITLYAWWI